MNKKVFSVECVKFVRYGQSRQLLSRLFKNPSGTLCRRFGPVDAKIHTLGIRIPFSRNQVCTYVDIPCGKETLSSTVIKIDNENGIDILREGPIGLDEIYKEVAQ